MRKRKDNRTAGFSLIEVVVGIAVLGLVTAPVCASLVLSVRLNAHARALMNARLQAAGVVETLLAEGVNTGDWTETEERCWEKTLDGVELVAEQADASDEFYKVTATCTVGDEEVEFVTRVRKDGDT